MPHSHDADRLLNAHLPTDEGTPAGRPPVQRTPTRKERIPVAAPAPPAQAAAPVPVAPPAPKPDEDDALPFRPVRRPPVALLCIFDDTGEDGEWVRLRDDTVTIGRSQGDVLIPHDGLMSGRHAEITRVADGGKYRWLLADLGSTNGTYVKVDRAALRPGREVMFGRTRLRIDAPTAEAPTEPGQPAEAGPKATVGWSLPDPAAVLPSVVEVMAKGDGRRWTLAQAELTVGRDLDCTISLSDDPLVSRRHARLVRDAEGHWQVIAGPGGRNGVWLRLAEPLPVGRNCVFLLGEQRFQLRIP